MELRLLSGGGALVLQRRGPWSWAAGGANGVWMRMAANLSNKNSIPLWAGLVQANNFPTHIRRLTHSSHEDCRRLLPHWSASRVCAGAVIDTRIVASPSWNLRWHRT
jgi:hypothetical protein